MKHYLGIAVLLLLTACNGSNDNGGHDPDLDKLKTPVIDYKIVAEYPHDTSSYTEGLQVHNGKFYEGTGMENESTIQISDIKTGKIEQRHLYTDPKIFGEGIQVFKNKIYQLTWKNHIVYVYDINDIKNPIKQLSWPYEGWGMTNNGTDLIISDGSANLYFVDPENFSRPKTTILVKHENDPVGNLNELEYVNGFIYANVWQTNYIYKIDPSNGNVIGRIELPDLKQQYFADKVTDRTDVLNGIAYDSSTKKMYITGKRWPKMFEIEVK